MSVGVPLVSIRILILGYLPVSIPLINFFISVLYNKSGSRSTVGVPTKSTVRVQF